jgi:CRISPR-associated protein Csx17
MSSQGAEHSFEVELTGCRVEPLASYLKALGVLRLVGQQKDRNARGFWRGEHFVLQSSLDREALVTFFSDAWEPTPVVAPWNGGSGFYPKDNCAAADAIAASDKPRLKNYALTIDVARKFVAAQGWKERPADESKILLISAMRARLPDVALAWLDAALVIGDERLLFPPLLGTGGNDGRLDFSNNFQQRVVEVVEAGTSVLLESSLFGATTTTRFEGTMGQYQPSAGKRTNPWDFVLLIEGALLFAAAATRRYESASPTTMAFPFHARAAGGLATLTDSDEEESRDELWLPLWPAPTTIRELRQLFAEGRATVGSGDRARTASTSLDFARAVSALGVDRGIESFLRIGFHVRNGLAYFATPLGRFPTREVPAARLLDDVDSWFERFRQKASGGGVPARIAIARRRLEQAMFEAARTGGLAPVLIALTDAELALGRSLAFTAKAFLNPVPRLGPAWATAVADGSVEQRLGAALAARGGIRRRLLPLDPAGRFGREDELGFVFVDRPLVENLHALLNREDVEELQGRSLTEGGAGERCSLSDIAAFISGAVDDVLVERWLRAAVLVEGGVAPEVPRQTVLPPASFAVLALVHGRRLGAEQLPRTVGVLSRACAGDAASATAAAIRRLNAAGRPLPIRALNDPPARMRRIAAALAFPLTSAQRRTLESMVLPAASNAPSDDFSIAVPQEQV